MRRASGLSEKLRGSRSAMTRLRVKVCGMREETNVALITACGPDYIGFIFVPSSLRYAGNDLKPSTVQAVPSTITTVGVFQNEEPDRVVEIATRYGLKAVQLHGDEDRLYSQYLRRALPQILILKAVSVRSATDVTNQNTLSGVDAIVFDNGKGGTGETFNWAFLSEYRGATPFFVAGGVGTDNIVDLRSQGRAWNRFLGVDVSSRVEDSPGIKSATKVRALLAKATGYDD